MALTGRRLARLAANATAGVMLAMLAGPQSGAASLRDLRYRSVVEQSDWFTCGPAAAATLLARYFGQDVSQEQVLQLSLRFMAAGELGRAPTSGITLLALRRAMEALGVPALGFRVGLEALTDYFGRGGLPAILHVRRPRPHYVVAVGQVEGQLVVDDPWWGREVKPLVEWAQARGFGGIALVPAPPTELARPAVARQARELAEALRRLRRLRALGAGGL